MDAKTNWVEQVTAGSRSQQTEKQNYESAFEDLQTAAKLVEKTARQLAGDVHKSKVAHLILIAHQLEIFFEENS